MAGTDQEIFPIKYPVLFLFLVLFCIPTAGAAEVTLSIPQSEYYFLTGDEAIIPLTLVSTCDHDITGTLKQVITPVMPEPASPSIHERTFAAFTDERTVSLSVLRSNVPADYRLMLMFSYPEAGGRVSTLGEIGIHFVTSMEENAAGHHPLVSTDSANPQVMSTPGSPSEENPDEHTPDSKLQNNQISQDTTALKNQLANESNQSARDLSELEGYLMADPLMVPLVQSLTGAGFTLEKTDITPVSDTSGTFLLTYSSGTMKAQIKGVVQETHVLFAEESSGSPVPLPDALGENETYHEYGSRIADMQFLRDVSRINVTPGQSAVELTYSNPQNRILHVKAIIETGRVTDIETDNPDDLLPQVMPALALISAILISAGIWYLARHRMVEQPDSEEQPVIAEPVKNSREIADLLLDEAEEDARQGSYPDAYRKTGRALRLFFAHESGNNYELTTSDVEQFIGSCTGNPRKITMILDRCRSVGFAKGTPEPGEIREMIRYSRSLLHAELSGTDPGILSGQEQLLSDDKLHEK
jgi:hypothetical protein